MCVYAKNYEIENRINLKVSNNDYINVLALNQHRENDELRFDSDLSLTYEYFAQGSIEGSDELPSYDNTNEIPESNIGLDSLTNEELQTIIEEYELSETQLQVIVYIFLNDDAYATYDDFMNLVQSNISALIDIYNEIN